jgi:transcriptional regulator with XRE-family HTH domain
MRRPKPTPLDKQVARFLRKHRGKMTFAQFSKKTGLMASTLFRLENAGQSITVKKLHHVLKRLKCSVRDVFLK